MKRFFSLAAVLCCAMSMMMFTACGDDETPEPKTPEQQDPQQQDPQTPTDSTDIKARAYAKVVGKFYHTEDMLKYFDIKIVYQLNDDSVLSYGPLALDDVDSALVYLAPSHIVEYPATIKFYREVTVKEGLRDSVAAMDNFHFSNQFSYVYGYYDANKQMITAYQSNKTYGINSPMKGETALKDVEERGACSYVYTFTFDDKGDMTYTYPRPRN